MASKITFEDKEQINQITEYPEKNQCTADNLNEIKKVVNENADETKKQSEDITKIQEEQTTQKKAIETNTKDIEQNTTDITKLQEDNAKLKAQIPTGTAAGEEISLSDSAEMELVDFGLQGNSKQETREGYNLANYNTKVDKNTPNFDIGDIKQQQVYTLYLYIPTGTISFNLKNKSNDSIILSDWNKTGKVLKTFTANQDDILRFNGFGSAGDYAGISEIMLLEGTYTIENLPDFEEYGVMPSLRYPSEVEAVGDSENVEIVRDNLGKNKITLPDSIKEINGITINVKDGVINISGQSTVHYTTYINVGTTKIENGKTYYLNDFGNKSGGVALYVNNASIWFPDKVGEEKTWQSNADGIFNIQLSFGGYEKQNWNLKLLLSEEPGLDWIEGRKEIISSNYQLPIQKLMLNGDYIDLDSKKEAHTYTKKVVSNIDEFDVNKNGNDKTFQIFIDITNPIQNTNVICNMFKYNPNVWNETGCQISENIFYGIIKFGDFGFTEDLTKDQAKQKFAEIIAETNLVFYYKTTTPEEMDLTKEQSQILEQIVKDGTYKGVTHYFTEDEVKPTIEVKYYKDLETIINKQEQMQATLNNVQAQILELGV